MSHPTVSREQWLTARKSFLAREKELTHLRDKITAERMALPWVKVDKPYTFQTPAGPRTLVDLFASRSQLLIYHFMFDPDWDAGCKSCSFLTDHANAALPHLEHHDVTYINVSRAPLEKLDAYKKRMGWNIPWVSSAGSDFNYDFGVSFTDQSIADGSGAYNFDTIPITSDWSTHEMPGLSAFYKDESGAVFHTYSAYARGLDDVLATYQFLDRAPKGRNEKSGMEWVRRHDEYAPNLVMPK
jgi:predicted dithiol-disulfide oxidoreductase (DUF899 family)